VLASLIHINLSTDLGRDVEPGGMTQQQADDIQVLMFDGDV